MAETVGQHAVAAFTSPVNGATPIDANTVRGNDNTIRVAYVDHDADPGIHVQSSALASRPIAGVAGRKWMTVDGTVTRLWYDTGSTWLEMQSSALSTARTLWGQSFDGTANVSGNLSSVGNIAMTGALSGATSLSATNLTGTLQTAAQPNVTSVGTLSSLTVSGNLGVGTVTANARLHSSATTATAFRTDANTGVAQWQMTVNGFGQAGRVLADSSGNVTFDAATTLALYVNGATRATLDSSGNLGLGVTPSAWTVRTLQMTNEFGIGHLGYSRNSFYDGAYKYITTGLASMYQMSSGQHQWFNAASGTAGAAITFTQAMTLNASGELLVGSALGDTAKLSITGPTGLAGSGLSIYETSTGNTNRLRIFQDNGFVVYNATFGAGSNYHTWQIANVERMRLDTSGNLGIGTTPTYRLDALAAAGAGNVFRAGQLSVSNGYTITTNGTALTHRWASAAADIMTLDSQGSGTLMIGTTSAFNGGANRGNITLNGATDAIFNFGNGGTNSGYIWSTSTYLDVNASSTRYLSFSTNATERARIDASGNLGLGVTPSTTSIRTLQVLNTSLSSPGSDLYLTGNAVFNSPNWVYLTSTTAAQYVQSNGTHQWLNAPSGTAGATVNLTQRMLLDASGNLGIGGTPGAYRLDVVGSMRCFGDVLSSATSASTFGTLTNQDLRFTTNNSARWVISSTGNLLAFSDATYDIGASGATRPRDVYLSGKVVYGTGAARLQVGSADGAVGGIYGNATGEIVVAADAFRAFNKAASVERMRIDNTTTAGQTALMLWDVDNGTLERVTVGAADSGGVGFKVLRIPN